MTGRDLLSFAVTLVLAAPPAAAQGARRVEPRVADEAIAAGRLDDAESELYRASARSPREPSARAALGGFLAARGRLKAGAVLLEEARELGGDARAIDARLAHIYRWSSDWPRAATLVKAPFTRAESERARWLATHPESTSGPESSAVRLAPSATAPLGRITIVAGGDSLEADIDPSLDGLVLPAMFEGRAEIRRFGAQGAGTIAVVSTVTIGACALSNVPTRLERGARVRVGLDLLARLSPTFDMAAGRLTLRTRQRSPSEAGRAEFPLLLTFPGVQVGMRPRAPLVGLDSPSALAALRGVRWTFDLRRGAVVIER